MEQGNTKAGTAGKWNARVREWWAVPDRKKQGERFGLGVGLALAVMAAVALYRGLEARTEVLALISAALLGLALVLPDLLYPPAWLVETAFKLTTKALLFVLLILTFYLVFTPLGILLRIIAPDPMKRKWEPDAATYWSERKPRDPTHAEKQF
jgi:hypothetical protein